MIQTGIFIKGVDVEFEGEFEGERMEEIDSSIQD